MAQKIRYFDGYSILRLRDGSSSDLSSEKLAKTGHWQHSSFATVYQQLASSNCFQFSLPSAPSKSLEFSLLSK